MIVSAPKNLTFSSGRPSRWWASDHACGELCSRDRVDCVLEIVLGEAGSYKERISFAIISSDASKTVDSKKKRARKANRFDLLDFRGEKLILHRDGFFRQVSRNFVPHGSPSRDW